jgi:hypothetical protein
VFGPGVIELSWSTGTQDCLLAAPLAKNGYGQYLLGLIK